MTDNTYSFKLHVTGPFSAERRPITLPRRDICEGCYREHSGELSFENFKTWWNNGYALCVQEEVRNGRDVRIEIPLRVEGGIPDDHHCPYFLEQLMRSEPPPGSHDGIPMAI